MDKILKIKWNQMQITEVDYLRMICKIFLNYLSLTSVKL